VTRLCWVNAIPKLLTKRGTSYGHPNFTWSLKHSHFASRLTKYASIILETLYQWLLYWFYWRVSFLKRKNNYSRTWHSRSYILERRKLWSSQTSRSVSGSQKLNHFYQDVRKSSYTMQWGGGDIWWPINDIWLAFITPTDSHCLVLLCTENTNIDNFVAFTLLAYVSYSLKNICNNCMDVLLVDHPDHLVIHLLCYIYWQL